MQLQSFIPGSFVNLKKYFDERSIFEEYSPHQFIVLCEQCSYKIEQTIVRQISLEQLVWGWFSVTNENLEKKWIHWLGKGCDAYQSAINLKE